MDLERRLSKAKTRLIIDHPFIGTIAIGMRMLISETCGENGPANPTAATDGRHVWYNPKFIEPLNDEQLMFLVAHECLHPMLEHNYRRHARNPMKWNKAADYVINQLLKDEGIGQFIDGGCLDPSLYQRGGGTSEGIYNILPEEDGDGSEGNPVTITLIGQPGGKGQKPYDQIIDGGKTQAEMEANADQMKVNVAQAAQAAKMVGKMSANMQRLVDEIMAPKVDWREVLRRFVEKVRSDQRTWTRPARRFLWQDMYLPTVSGEALGEIHFSIDCSGSIGSKELNQFAAEIRAVKEEGNPTKLHVTYFDSEVCHYDVFSRDEDVSVAPHGGGGTAFSPIFRYLNKHDITPVATIVLTDLYCGDYGTDPGHPVLWVSTVDHGDGGYGKPPFGEVVVMKDMEL
jgi:predicted metal-dependent peptidase